MEAFDGIVETIAQFYDRFRRGEFAPSVSWDQIAALSEGALLVLCVLVYFIVRRRLR